MGLAQHLEELRRALINIMVILAASFLVTYGFGEFIVEWILYPLRNSLQEVENSSIVYLGILDKVMGQFQVAFWSSIILSSPLWFWQIWKFVKPGLHPHEIRVIRPFLFFGLILFWLGVGFGHFIVFPLTFEMLHNFGVGQVQATIGLKAYLVLACKVLVFLGLVFQLPNALLILGFMGLVTKYSLRNMRRYIYVAFAVVAAMLTPPDPYTMLGLWLPLILLFEVGIIAVALLVHPYLERRFMRQRNTMQKGQA